MRLYHVTTTRSAEAIRRDGFKDRRKHLGADADTGKPFYVSGVWFSDRPWFDGGNCDADTLPRGYEVLEIEIDGRRVGRFEVKDLDGTGTYREWCIPAAVANLHLVRQR